MKLKDIMLKIAMVNDLNHRIITQNGFRVRHIPNSAEYFRHKDHIDQLEKERDALLNEDIT